MKAKLFKGLEVSKKQDIGDGEPGCARDMNLQERHRMDDMVTNFNPYFSKFRALFYHRTKMTFEEASFYISDKQRQDFIDNILTFYDEHRTVEFAVEAYIRDFNMVNPLSLKKSIL